VLSSDSCELPGAGHNMPKRAAASAHSGAHEAHAHTASRATSTREASASSCKCERTRRGRTVGSHSCARACLSAVRRASSCCAMTRSVRICKTATWPRGEGAPSGGGAYTGVYICGGGGNSLAGGSGGGGGAHAAAVRWAASRAASAAGERWWRVCPVSSRTLQVAASTPRVHTVSAQRRAARGARVDDGHL
jgi:hypothetical protein